MDFSQLMSLAKKNEHDAKDQLKKSKDPVLEFSTPGKEIKVKRDMTAIQARVQAHQERLKKEIPIQKPSVLPKPDVKKPQPPPTNGGLQRPPQKSSSHSQLVKKPSLSGSSNLAKPGGSGIRPSQNPSSSNSVKPPQNGHSSSKDSNKGNSVKISTKPVSKPLEKSSKPPESRPKIVRKPQIPAAPVLTFQEMLRIAADQQKNPLPPEAFNKSNIAPPTAAVEPRFGKLQHGSRTSVGESVKNGFKNAKNSNASEFTNAHMKQQKSAVRPVSSKSTESINKKPVPQAPPPRNNETKSRAHMISNKIPLQKPAPAQNMKNMTGNPQKNGVKNGSQPSVSGVKSRIAPAQTKTSITPVASANAKSGPAKYHTAAKPPPPGNANKPGQSSKAVPPPVRVPAKSAYPERFDPFQSSMKKRPLPSHAHRNDDYDDESDYDDEMDDFIDDTPYDGEEDVSEHIKQIFGYDRRKYVNRPVDDDDIDDMETGIHQQWKEEAISAFIGRKEDEMEEERERQELARERARKKMKRY